jgi:hypothetical protein
MAQAMGNNSSLPTNLLKHLSDRLLAVDTHKQVEDFAMLHE